MMLQSAIIDGCDAIIYWMRCIIRVDTIALEWNWIERQMGGMLQRDLIEWAGMWTTKATGSLGTGRRKVIPWFALNETFKRVPSDDRAGMSNNLSSLIDQEVLRSR
jgi:hypothetical protein